MEERLVSAEEVHCAAVQLDNSNMAFLLMAEAMVATTTTSLSTVTLGVSSSLRAEMIMNIPGLLLPQQHPGK
jgi:hypothetical protein